MHTIQEAEIANSAQPAEVQAPNPLDTSENIKQHIPATMESIFGSISWLMLHSPMHRYLFISDYEWLVMPALQLKQFKIIRQDNIPIAYVSWAYVTEETESRIKQGTPKLAPHEWNKGDRIWIIDVIAPFGGGVQILQKLQSADFKDKQVKLMRPRKDGKGMVGVFLEDVLKEAENLESLKTEKSEK
jgi:cytolysin-activating lysine-acyltransferase